jgi:hypothetical protein
MKEKQIREIVRNQIIKKMNEAPSRFSQDIGSVRGLSRAKSGLGKSLDKVDTSAISKLGRSQKIKLLTSLLSNVGITAQDFGAIKNAVGRNLAGTIAPADESIEEANALDARGDKLDKTQVFKQLVKVVNTKPASMQADFVMDLIGKLNLDDSAKRKLRMKVKSDLK